MIASLVLGMVGVLILAEGLFEWRRRGLGVVETLLLFCGIALIGACIWYQATDHTRFARTLKPSIHMGTSPPPPLPPSVRPRMLPAPGPERVGDSLITA